MFVFYIVLGFVCFSCFGYLVGVVSRNSTIFKKEAAFLLTAVCGFEALFFVFSLLVELVSVQSRFTPQVLDFINAIQKLDNSG